ncbi:MAG: MSHA biogenesis protein MshP [Burkholderiaceae bacterium]|jgi:MSHA biogenesis protein MshP
MNSPRAHSRGFGSIAILVVLVMLAALAAAIVRLSSSAQASSALDTLGTRADQAARAGVEWGLYQALKGSWTTCSATSQTLDLRADLGMMATVTCSSTAYNEGETSPGVAKVVRVYTIDATGCNSSTCPDNARAVQSGYVERRRQIQATN